MMVYQMAHILSCPILLLQITKMISILDDIHKITLNSTKQTIQKTIKTYTTEKRRPLAHVRRIVVAEMRAR